MPPREWFDNHCHLDGAADAEEQVAEALGAGVVGLLTVGVDVRHSRWCRDFAAGRPSVWATAGVHPHEAEDGTDGLDELLRQGRADGSVVAVGECGLDYHYLHSPAGCQREVFRRQIGLAHALELPLVIHSREAWEDTFELLDAEGMPDRTVFHCFTGGPDEASEALRRGAWLSFSGIVTFPSATELRAAVRAAPLDRVMVETDSPYLAPVPHRGRRNRPALVVRVGEEVASLMGRDLEEVARATVATTRAFYALPDGDGVAPMGPG